MVTPESIKQSIQSGLACEHVEVLGDGQHFQALIVSAEFTGRSRVATSNAALSAPSTATVATGISFGICTVE